MTLNEIAYNLLNLVRGGKSNQDESISLDQIKFNIKHYRAMFIRRDFAKNGFTSRHIEQDLGCLELKKVDPTRCCSLPSSCSVYRTIEPIPKTVRHNFKESITHVGDITGTGTIPIVHSNVIKFLSYDKYTNKKYKAYMIEDYLYIYNADGLKFINVRGVFEDPEEIAKFKDCGGSDCYDADTIDYPIPMDMVQAINSGILAGELRLLAGTLSDTLNDRSQDIETRTNIGGGGGAPKK
tara:strand:+ start:5569 stop:6282 length:714 start_codon:yes stop_codon:yes gene_type:complete